MIDQLNDLLTGASGGGVFTTQTLVGGILLAVYRAVKRLVVLVLGIAVLAAAVFFTLPTWAGWVRLPGVGQ